MVMQNVYIKWLPDVKLISGLTPISSSQIYHALFHKMPYLRKRVTQLAPLMNELDPYEPVGTLCYIRIRQLIVRFKLILFTWPLNPLECKGNYSATSNNMKLVHWPLMGVDCYIWYSEERIGLGHSSFRRLVAVPNVTAHLWTASVPITVLLYNGWSVALQFQCAR